MVSPRCRWSPRFLRGQVHLRRVADRIVHPRQQVMQLWGTLGPAGCRLVPRRTSFSRPDRFSAISTRPWSNPAWCRPSRTQPEEQRLSRHCSPLRSSAGRLVRHLIARMPVPSPGRGRATTRSDRTPAYPAGFATKPPAERPFTPRGSRQLPGHGRLDRDQTTRRLSGLSPSPRLPGQLGDPPTRGREDGRRQATTR